MHAPEKLKFIREMSAHRHARDVSHTRRATRDVGRALLSVGRPPIRKSLTAPSFVTRRLNC